MEVSFQRLIGPEFMVPAMRVTKGKDMYEEKMPSLDLWFKMLLSEHSSIRAVVYRVFCEDVPYYTHTHIVRHHLGFQPHVKSQRKEQNREDLPQGALVDMLFDANAQALISIARKRLCHKADQSAQDLLEKLKTAFIYTGDSYDKVMGGLMMRPCSWFPGYCAEPNPCGRIVGINKLSMMHQHILNEVKND